MIGASDNIGWYPGHMAKTKRELKEYIKLVDIVVELLDARIPNASRNPDIDELSRGKGRVVVLNKADLADEKINIRWAEYFAGLGITVVKADSVKGTGMSKITSACVEMMKEKTERQRARGRIFTPCRAMIAGIPNVGKSTLINRYAGRGVAKTGDRPGVTRSGQWIKIKTGFELLDTPGILWPKLGDADTGVKLALTGAIKDEILDAQELCLKLIEMIKKLKPEALTNRYGITIETNEPAPAIREKIAEARGFKIKGGKYDIPRASAIIIDEFRAAKIARISLEAPR